MAQKRCDGVVEAAHFAGAGRLDWVRLHDRRGAAFADYVVVSRQELVKRLQEGKKIFTAQRKKYQGLTFELAFPLELQQRDGQEVIVAGSAQGAGDRLEGVPFL